MSTYTCQVCRSGKSFSYEENLNRHIKDKHSLLKQADDREYAICRDVLKEFDFKRPGTGLPGGRVIVPPLFPLFY